VSAEGVQQLLKQDLGHIALIRKDLAEEMFDQAWDGQFILITIHS
jgi:hypothetical protein